MIPTSSPPRNANTLNSLAGPARAGELPPRRDPGLQPGRLQHGGLPRHADRQGGVPAQPPRLPARPGLTRPSAARSGGRRINPLAAETSLILTQAAGRGPPRGGAAADPQLQDLRVPPRLDQGRGQGRPRRARRRPARDPARVARAERPGQVAAGRRPGPSGRRHRPATSRRSATTTRPTPRSPRSTPTGTSSSRPGARSRSSPITSTWSPTSGSPIWSRSPGFKPAQVPQDNVIDRAVFAKLNRMRISPSEPCTDQEFIRRVYLDAIGVLPTPAEVEDVPGRSGRAATAATG